MITPYKETLRILREEIGYGATYYEGRKDGSRRLKYYLRPISEDHLDNIVTRLENEGFYGVNLYHVKNSKKRRSLVAEIPEEIVSGVGVVNLEADENFVNPGDYSGYPVQKVNVLDKLFSGAKYLFAGTLVVIATLLLLPVMYIASLFTKQVVVDGTKIYLKNKYGNVIGGMGFGL